MNNLTFQFWQSYLKYFRSPIEKRKRYNSSDGPRDYFNFNHEDLTNEVKYVIINNLDPYI